MIPRMLDALMVDAMAEIARQLAADDTADTQTARLNELLLASKSLRPLGRIKHNVLAEIGVEL